MKWLVGRGHKDITFTVDFDANGGTEVSDQQTYAVGDVYADLPSMEKTGYKFTGWYKDQTLRGGGSSKTGTPPITPRRR